jgi:hypothetical protein
MHGIELNSLIGAFFYTKWSDLNLPLATAWIFRHLPKAVLLFICKYHENTLLQRTFINSYYEAKHSLKGTKLAKCTQSTT